MKRSALIELPNAHLLFIHCHPILCKWHLIHHKLVGYGVPQEEKVNLSYAYVIKQEANRCALKALMSEQTSSVCLKRSVNYCSDKEKKG